MLVPASARAATVDPVAATYPAQATSATRHPLAQGASPAAIRASLLAEDQGAFDVAYEQALTEAKSTKDLTGLFTTLERWRRLATLQSDPEVFRRVARHAAELHTGESRPADEPLAATRALTGI